MATIIFKPTDRCNSNCAYCSVAPGARGTDMPRDLLALLFRRIDEYLSAHPEETVVLTWHGGEPLMLGPEYFNLAWSLQQQFCAKTQDRIEHLLQSNLTLFHEGFVEPFHRLGIDQIGSSYDPIPNVRGPGPDRNSERYNRMFLDAVERVEQHGLAWAIIYTVTRLSLARPADVFYFTTNLEPKRGVQFNYVEFPSRLQNELAITPGEFVEFLGAVFRLWWPVRHRLPTVRPFDSILRHLTGAGPSIGCFQSGRCAESHASVGPQGDISHCGRSLDWGVMNYGNIRDHSFDDVFQNPLRRLLHDRTSALRAGECGGCRFWSVCHGLCPLDAFDQHGNFDRKSKWCPTTRDFIEKHVEPVTGLRFPDISNGFRV